MNWRTKLSLYCDFGDSVLKKLFQISPGHPRVLGIWLINPLLAACFLLNSCTSIPSNDNPHTPEYADSNPLNTGVTEEAPSPLAKSPSVSLIADDGSPMFSPMPNAPVVLVPPPEMPSVRIIEPVPAPPPVQSAPPDFPLNTAEFLEILTDDLDKDSLIQVVENHLAVLKTQDLSQTLKLGALTITRGRLKETLEEFLRLLSANLSPEVFSRKVREEFIFYAAGKGRGNRVVFTGYYTPIIQASHFKTESYRYPLYQIPKKLIQVKYIYRQRLADGQYSTFHFGADGLHYTRGDIDGRKVLQNKNLEIAWLNNDLERYFLHIQGSGILRYPDNSRQGVRYAGSNGYPYKGIGRLMLDDGVLSSGSMQGIKKYFEDHPHEIRKYLFQNKRYIFFSLSNDNPRGSSNAELVAGRSIAADDVFYPAGALGFITARKPVLNDSNKISGWEKFSRFVINQDTGSAIKGRGRMDLYFGVGERAGVGAGHYMEKGRMFFLIKK